MLAHKHYLFIVHGHSFQFFFFKQYALHASKHSDNIQHQRSLDVCYIIKWNVPLMQGSPDWVLEGRCPAEFSSNPIIKHT